MCVFIKAKEWKIGKILQFAKYKEKTKQAQTYKGCVAEVIANGIDL